MTTTQDPVPSAAHDEPNGTCPDDPVPVTVLVQEARDAGFVDWLADQIIQQCQPHGMKLDGDDGLPGALATAARERVTSRSAEPVRIAVTYHPTEKRTTVSCADPATTLATLRDVFLGLALTAGDLHPGVTIQRNRIPLRRY